MRYRFITPILSLLLGIFSFLIVPPARAFDIPTVPDLTELDKLIKEDISTKNLQEFCQRRSGDQMNLETWYSGKCVDSNNKPFDRFSGEGVGFSSIVLLDFYELVGGKKLPDESFTQKFKDMIEAITKFGLISKDTNQKDLQAFITEQRSNFFSSSDSGLVGVAGKSVTLLINNPPASSRNYLAYVSQNLKNHHVISQAYAADPGYGFAGLSGFLPLWRVTRNISYVAFILFFILYGFMMIFRVNINAKTVISVQLALPKLIFTLLIITFSYAIVGLMVDLMFVFFYVVIFVLDAQGIIKSTNLFLNMGSGQMGMILSFLNNAYFSMSASMIGISNMIFGGPALISAGLTTSFTWILGPLNLVIGLILALAILFSYANLFWKLLSAFMTVVIYLITAPIILLGNALPGSDSFGNWFKGIYANLSVFPVSMLLLMLSYILMVQPLVNCLGLCPRNNDGPISPGLEWVFGVRNFSNGEPFMYVPFVSPPIGSVLSGFGVDFFNNSPDAMMALFGVALLLMSCKYVDIVRDALKAPPFKYGSAITESLKTSYTTVKGAYEETKKKLSGGTP